jgi:hypothetical protein
MRPEKRCMEFALARMHPVDQINELNKVLIRGVRYDAKITVGFDGGPERNIRICSIGSNGRL